MCRSTCLRERYLPVLIPSFLLHLTLGSRRLLVIDVRSYCFTCPALGPLLSEGPMLASRRVLTYLGGACTAFKVKDSGSTVPSSFSNTVPFPVRGFSVEHSPTVSLVTVARAGPQDDACDMWTQRTSRKFRRFQEVRLSCMDSSTWSWKSYLDWVISVPFPFSSIAMLVPGTFWAAVAGTRFHKRQTLSSAASTSFGRATRQTRIERSPLPPAPRAFCPMTYSLSGCVFTCAFLSSCTCRFPSTFQGSAILLGELLW